MKVAVVTGTRAEYGIWIPVLEAIKRSPRLRLQLVVTGMHLLPEFGATWRAITRDGFTPAAKVPMYRKGDSPADSLARGTRGLARAFQKLAPDIVLVLGDRLEMLAAAQAAMCLHLPIGHVHGGETAPGQFDEQIRHAITKLAQVHFAATACAAGRIKQMGENPRHIHITGAPALDRARVAARTFLPQRRGTSGRPLLVLHPVCADEGTEFAQTQLVLRAIQHSGAPRGIDALGPNNDPGHRGILRCYAQQNAACFHMVPSVTQQQFWRMLWECPYLIGNSSAGIIEAATFGVPVVNIGLRQAGRQRSGNVVDVPYQAAAIRRAIGTVTSPEFRRRVQRLTNVYGTGRASARIVRVLERLARTKGAVFTAKRFFDRRED